jgi:hypothetical protein
MAGGSLLTRHGMDPAHRYPSQVGYQVQHRLGRGGMGVVDLAMAPDGSPVAIKRLVLHGSAHDMARARQRIHREAQALLTLDHPNIVRLLEVIEDGDDLILVMPYLAGGTLADQVRAHGPLTADQVRMLAPPLLSALAAAHRQGIVHRDIKPANVLFDADGRPYLADFGVASLRDATSGLTATGMVVGTPEFMAPEQARGEVATAASDVFSLGATLAFAATGNPPYGRGDPRVMVTLAAKGKVTPLPATVPSDLRRRIEPLLDRQPRRRPTAAAAQGGPAGTRVLAPAKPRRTWTSAALGATIGAVATVAILAAVTVAIARVGDDAGPAQAASVTTITTLPAPPCEDQPYKPCGGEAAPFTDGVRCTADHGDYDADPANGCEAAPVIVDPGALRNDQVVSANLVPDTNIDRYGFHVVDNWHLACDGEVKVTITAPKGSSMHLEIFEGAGSGTTSGAGTETGSRSLGGTTSSDGKAATVTLPEPNCLDGILGPDDATEMVARVSWADDRRTDANYRLTVTGSY